MSSRDVAEYPRDGNVHINLKTIFGNVATFRAYEFLMYPFLHIIRAAVTPGLAISFKYLLVGV